MDKRFLVVVAVVIVTVNTGIYFSGARVPAAGDCSVAITSPRAGDQVEITETASGSAAIGPGAHLWLLAKPRADGRWWPQGEAAVGGGAWEIPVLFGIENQKGEEFYLAAVAVPGNAHARLIEWLRRYAEGRRRPIVFPEVITGCPVDIVAVQRSK